MALLARTQIVASLSALAVAALSACGGEDASSCPVTPRGRSTRTSTRQAADRRRRCVGAEKRRAQVGEQIEALGGVDRRLKEALEKGAERLNEVVDECEETEEPESVRRPKSPPKMKKKRPDKKAKGRREGRGKEHEKEERAEKKEVPPPAPEKERRTTRAGKNPAGTKRRKNPPRVGSNRRARSKTTGGTVMEAGLLSAL